MSTASFPSSFAIFWVRVCNPYHCRGDSMEQLKLFPDIPATPAAKPKLSTAKSLSAPPPPPPPPPPEAELGDVVCYDAETSDADTRHAQIFQFASIMAGRDLVPRSEFSLRLRRMPYVVPAPEALAVTGLKPDELDNPEYPDEYAGARTIQSALKAAYGTMRVFLTFNGIKFDDELIRTMLFRNLLDPYVTSGRGTRRVDVMSLAQLAVHADPDVIAVARAPDTGKASWRLEHLAAANGIAINAHDALGDARATLTLARMVRERCRWAWEAALACGNSGDVDNRLSGLHGSGGVTWLFTHYGEPELIPCLVVGGDSRKRWLLIDLRADPETIAAACAAGDVTPGKDTPFKTVRSAGCPMILEPADAARIAAPGARERAEAAAAMLRADRSGLARALEAFRGNSYEPRTEESSEEKIYGGFPNRYDKDKMAEFHRATDWRQRARIRFEDPRLADFAARLVLRHVDPAVLDADGGALRERLMDDCRAAHARPYADASSRWATIAGASQTADAEWLAWAATAFPGALPDNPAP